MNKVLFTRARGVLRVTGGMVIMLSLMLGLMAAAPARKPLALPQLQELVEDTLMEVGSEAYVAALLVYNSAKSSGQGAALDELADALGRRFVRKSSRIAPQAQ